MSADTGRAPQQTSVWVLGDAVRGIAVLSLLVAAGGFGWVAGALFLLVLGATMIPRALGVPDALDVSYCAALVLAAWAAQLDWYVAVGWLDLVAHAVATGLIAAIAHVTFVRTGLVPPVDSPAVRRPRLGAAVVTLAAGVGLALVWELMEWAGHTFVDERIQVGYVDTMTDLLAGTAGALVAAVLLARGVLLASLRR